MPDLRADRPPLVVHGIGQPAQPGLEPRGRIHSAPPSVRPPWLTAQYAIVVIPTPPAATSGEVDQVVAHQPVGRAPRRWRL